jgi:hypothetical protein
MAENQTKLIPVDIWESQIERPEQVDAAIDRVKEGLDILRAKLANLRALRRLSVRVYGEGK